MLFLSSNNIHEIDLSNNTKLTDLLISSNNLTTIAIPQTTPLEHLRIDDNPLTQATIDYLLALPGYDFSWEVPENGTPEVVSIAPLVAYIDTPTQFTLTGINFPETMSAEIQGALCDEKVLVSSTSYTMMCQSDTEGDSTLTVYEIEDLVMANGTHSIEFTDIPVVPPTLIPEFVDLNPKTVISGTSDVLFAVSGTNLPNTLAMALEHSDTCTTVTVNSTGTAATITCDIPETVLTQLNFYVKNKPGAEGGDIITGANNLIINITQPEITVANSFDYPLGHKGLDDNGTVIEFAEQLSIESNNAYETQIGIEDNHSRSCNGVNTECSADYVSSNWRNAQDVGSYYSSFTGLHPGEDWNKGSGDSDAGEPVYAVANGELFGIRSSYSTPQKGAWTIVIKHTLQDSSEIYSVYTHVTALSEVDGAISSNTDSFSLPQAITKGQMIGRIAKGNNSIEGMTLSPSHLHFELRNNSPGTINNLWDTNDGYSNGYFQTANDSASIIAGMIAMQNLGLIDPSDFIRTHRSSAAVPANNIVLGVTFTDEAFAVCVQEHVTAQASSALADLTSLDCSNRNIVNVSELSYMTGLINLDLHDNPIVEVNLDANQALDTVNLLNTNLSQASLDYLITIDFISNLIFDGKINNCLPAATELACLVGLHELTTIHQTGRVNDFLIDGNILYAASSDGIRIFDIDDDGYLSKRGFAFKASYSGSAIDVQNKVAYMSYDDGLAIYDVINIDEPLLIGNLEIEGTISGIVVDGDIVYVANKSSGLQIINTQDLSAPVIISTLTTNSTAVDVLIDNNFAYIADGTFGLTVVDIENLYEPVEVANIPISGRVSKIKKAGNHLYITNEFNGLNVIDINDPLQPILIDSIKTNSYALDVTIVDDYAFIADSYGGLNIVDISIPTQLKTVGTINLGGRAWSLAVLEGKAYICVEYSMKVVDVSNPVNYSILSSTGSNAQGMNRLDIEGNIGVVASGGDIEFISLADPVHPIITGEFDSGAWYDDALIRGDFAYVVEAYSGLKILDISELESPKLVGSVNTPGRATSIDIQGDYIYIADSSEGSQIINVSNVNEPILVGHVDSPNAKGIQVVGNRAYIADFEAGLIIVDIDDPSNPIQLSTLSTLGQTNSVFVSNGYAYITQYGVAGLSIIDIHDESAPFQISTIATPGNVYSNALSVFIVDSTAYFAKGPEGIVIVDITDPYQPNIIGEARSQVRAADIIVDGNLAYVADGEAGITVMDIQQIIQRTNILRQYQQLE